MKNLPAKKDERTPPLACRPTKENEWLYKAVKKRKREMKHKSNSQTIESILVSALKPS